MPQNTVSRSKLTIAAMSQIAVCSAMLCVSAYISVPLPFTPVPITMQVLAVIMTALMLKPKLALTAQFIYTLLGIVGLPVFSGGKGGFGAIFSPTGGYIFGFLLASFLVSLLKGKTDSLIRFALVSVFVGIPCIYIPEICFYMIYANVGLSAAFGTVGSVFLLIDTGKCVAASVFSVLINKALHASKLK